MTDHDLAAQAEAALKLTTISYPEWQRRVAAGKYANVEATNWWKAFDSLDRIGFESPSGVTPPQPPITTIINAPTLGLNVTTTQHHADYVIDGTGDTAALFHQNAHGSSLKRTHMKRVGIGNTVPYGKHGVYGKVRNLRIEDLTCECSSYAADGVSFRMDGAVLRRFAISGAPHAITYYEESTTKGAVLFEDGDCTFRGDTAVWMDTNSAGPIIQTFTFRRVNMTGPAGSAFMKVQAGQFAGASVVAESCTLNGVPVTTADFPNVPNVRVQA